MKSIAVVLMLFSMSAQAKWHHYAIGGVLGALAANAMSAPAQPQPQQQAAPPPLPVGHSIIACSSMNGYSCSTNNGTLTPAQIARKAGYKYIYRSVYQDGRIMIEVGN